MKNIISDLDLVLFDSVDWIKSTCPIFEIDGHENREAWDYHHSHVDMVKINEDFIQVVQDWIDVGVERIFFITAREDINNMHAKTIEQLCKFFQHLHNADRVSTYLYMRNPLDYRPSHEIKEDIFLQHIYPYYYIDLFVDDSKKNCEAFAKYGINTWLYDKYHNDLTKK